MLTSDLRASWCVRARLLLLVEVESSVHYINGALLLSSSLEPRTPVPVFCHHLPRRAVYAVATSFIHACVPAINAPCVSRRLPSVRTSFLGTVYYRCIRCRRCAAQLYYFGKPLLAMLIVHVHADATCCCGAIRQLQWVGCGLVVSYTSVLANRLAYPDTSHLPMEALLRTIILVYNWLLESRIILVWSV